MSTGITDSRNFGKQDFPVSSEGLARNSDNNKPKIGEYDVEVCSYESEIISLPSDTLPAGSEQSQSILAREAKNLGAGSKNGDNVTLETVCTGIEGQCEVLKEKIKTAKLGTEKHRKLEESLSKKLRVLEGLQSCLEEPNIKTQQKTTKIQKNAEKSNGQSSETAGRMLLDKDCAQATSKHDTSKVSVLKKTHGQHNETEELEGCINDLLIKLTKNKDRGKKAIALKMAEQFIEAAGEEKIEIGKDLIAFLKKGIPIKDYCRQINDPGADNGRSCGEKMNEKSVLEDHVVSGNIPYENVQAELQRIKSDETDDVDAEKDNKGKLRKTDSEITLREVGGSNKTRDNGSEMKKESKDSKVRNSRADSVDQWIEDINDRKVRMEQYDPNEDMYKFHQGKLKALEDQRDARLQINGNRKSGDSAVKANASNEKESVKPVRPDRTVENNSDGMNLDRNRQNAPADTTGSRRHGYGNNQRLPKGEKGDSALASMFAEMENKPQELKFKQGVLDEKAVQGFIDANQGGIIGYVAEKWLKDFEESGSNHRVQDKVHDSSSEVVAQENSLEPVKNSTTMETLYDLTSTAFGNEVEQDIKTGKITDDVAAEMYQRRWSSQYFQDTGKAPPPYFTHYRDHEKSGSHQGQGLYGAGPKQGEGAHSVAQGSNGSNKTVDIERVLIEATGNSSINDHLSTTHTSMGGTGSIETPQDETDLLKQLYHYECNGEHDAEDMKNMIMASGLTVSGYNEWKKSLELSGIKHIHQERIATSALGLEQCNGDYGAETMDIATRYFGGNHELVKLQQLSRLRELAEAEAPSDLNQF